MDTPIQTGPLRKSMLCVSTDGSWKEVTSGYHTTEKIDSDELYTIDIDRKS
jgi:hypothetical protein